MGVKGLWTLLEPAGYPISLESLEGKIIAVDISIWINQSIKGIRDKRGILAENAHLLGLFNRICKLLFYKIKPVFVFDGGAPALKRQTIEERRLRRENILSKAKSNVNKVLRSYISDKMQKEIDFDDEDEAFNETTFGLKEWTAKDDGGLFILPDQSPEKEEEAKKEEVGEDWRDFEFSAHPKLRHLQDTSLIDTESDDFKSLPPEIRHELLAEMREKKKKLNQVEDIPTATGDFSSYQMQRILVRRKIQEKMEEVQGEMVANISNKAASNLTSAHDADYQGITASRVMSDDSTHFVYLNKRRMENKDDSPKILMPKRRKEEPQRDFRPAKAYRDLFSSIDDFDFGIKEETEKEGATSLRDKIKKETQSGPIFKIGFKSVKGKSTKSLGKTSFTPVKSVVHSESESESEDDFVAVEELQISDDPSDGEQSDCVPMNDQPSTSGFSSPKKVATEAFDCSTSTIPENQSNQPILDTTKVFEPQSNVSQSPFTDFDNPVASTSKEADRIESQMANLSTSSNSSENQFTSIKPPQSVSIESSTDKGKPNKKISLTGLDSDDSDLYIEEEIVTPVKKRKPSVDIEVLEKTETPIIKSHHFVDVTNPTPVTTPTRTVSSLMTPNKSTKSVTTQQTPKTSTQTTLKTPTTPKSLSVPKTPTTPKTPFNKTPPKQTASPLVTPIKVLSAMDRTDEINEQIRDCKKAERQTSTVAQNMISDCRELLSMFGIPYVMSPMEAEAQCAALEIQGLTHGTITDDSDVWLFGGKTVFKNFFNQSKFVEMYRMDDIEKKLKLDRDTMICVALMTGCDYTDGVEGVGTVKATEILSEFPGKGLERLRNFADWWRSRKKGNDKSPGNKLRSQLLKLNLSDNFPSDLVYKAFISPIVLDSSEKFSWGVPDLDLLRRYAGEKMRWSKEKIDTTLIPIIRKLNEKQNQLRIDQFIKLRTNNNKMAYGSKRLANAVNKMSGSSEPTVEIALSDKCGMSKLREKVKNQRRKGRTANQLVKQSNNKVIKGNSKRNGANKKQIPHRNIETETVQLSDSSSECE